MSDFLYLPGSVDEPGSLVGARFPPVPHDLLLPHVAAVVHHGGAGTTAAAAAAGRPQVICPFVADQPFWGHRMHSLGVAPAPLDQRALSAVPLADRIVHALSDAAIADAAAELGARIRLEDGAGAAVRHLETLVGVPTS